MALAKDKHYWTQLRTAITAGQWDSELPGKDLKGYTLNWANLLRKFNKHCPGQNEFAEVVSQTHHLYLQLAAGQQKSATDSSQRSQRGPLDLGDEVVLPEERQQEGQAGYDVLKTISSPSEVSAAELQMQCALDSIIIFQVYFACLGVLRLFAFASVRILRYII